MYRRKFLASSLALGTGLGWQAFLPAWAQSALLADALPALSGTNFDLNITEEKSRVVGRTASHIRLNDQFPAPLLRWREGDTLSLNIHNALDEPSSIHWHGILLPWEMDGVPGVSFPGIAARSSFTYRFQLQQAGTYWYHSHSGFQEQLGHYGPIIIDPLEPAPYAYEREYVVMLSDWTFEDPQRVFSKLKKMSDNYNFQQRTVGEFFRDVKSQGMKATLADRKMWGEMRMSPTDFADVTAATYTFLVNGHGPEENWTGLFRPGERVRLRFINASAMSIFNVRIPGLPMTVVQNDGLDVQPVETDEFQIGTAETFDVIVQPTEDLAYTIMAETNDFFGYARATLAPRAGMEAVIPPLRKRPLLGMQDMGMDHGDHGDADADHAGHDMAALDHSTMDHSTMDHSTMDHSTMDHGAMDHSAHAGPIVADEHSQATMERQSHNHQMGPGVVNVSEYTSNRLAERPLGLEDEAHRVLVYAQLRSLQPNPDQRAPERELELHLTGNMERYMWSFDGLKFSEVNAPIPLRLGERVRLTFVNDTMMPHPVHLHGMFFDLVNGDDSYKPRKHTLVIKPAEKVSVDVTADAEGFWAFHCHLLYHMHAGMMRVFSVLDGELS
jgi:CopA family copper-resistance protein